MEISNFEDNIPEENKKQKIIQNLLTLKNKYKALNNLEFPKNELLLQIDSYTNLIKKISINLNITNVQLYLNSLDNKSSYLNNNLLKNFEEKNSFYKEYNEFINSIIDKIYILNKIKNDIVKNKSKIINLKKNCEENKELNLIMNINNINSIKDCITNPIFIKYINEDIYNNITNINKLFNDYQKFISRNNQNINEIYNINKEFTKEIKNCSLIFKDMKNKYFCSKYMKNTGDNTFKIHNNIFNGYIKIIFDYFLKLSQFVIKKISEENLKLQRISFNKDAIFNEEKDININEDFNQIKINNIHQNKKDELNSIINEGFKYAFGKIEKFDKNNMNKNILNLDDEFCFEKDIINNINNINKNNDKDIFNEERRKNDYQNLFNFTQKLSELNKDNNEIIINLAQTENGFNYRKKELDDKKNLLNEKYLQIIKINNNEELIKEKKYLENEYNSIKLQEQEIELNLDELKMKFQQNILNNKNIKLLNNEKKNEDININNKTKEEQKEQKEKEVIINNNNENKEREKEVKENMEEKQKKNLEENKKEIINTNINEKPEEIKIKVDKNKNFFLFENNFPFRKENKKEEEKNNESNNNNKIINTVINQENNIIKNNPFSLEINKEKENKKENEDDAIVKQIRALDNLPSVLSNRHSNSNRKKESPSPTVFKRGINNEKNLNMLFSGLNINNSITSNFTIPDKKISTKKKEIKEEKIPNPFSTININSNNKSKTNDSKSKPNLFDFDSKPNSNNPFNMILNDLNKKPNPFNIQRNIINNNINNNQKNNFFSQQQPIINKENNGIFKNFNLSNINNQDNGFNQIKFGEHKSTLNPNHNNFGNFTNNNNFNLINYSFGNNNNINGRNINNNNNFNNNNSQSPFNMFTSNQGINNLRNGADEKNDDNYF